VTLTSAPFPTALILAGGLGTRLRGAVADRPKVLAPVAGRPFLFHLLDELAAAGVREVVLCTSYMAASVEAAVGGSYGCMAVHYSVEEEPLGTGGALRQALDLTASETLLVANGDSLFRTDLGRFWGWHVARELQGSILLAQVGDGGRFGRVEVDAHGRIGRFTEKDGVAAPGWINAGIYLLHRSWIAEIPAGRPVSLEQEFFPRWLSHGLHGLMAEGRFMDIGTPESYRQAEMALCPDPSGGGHDHQPNPL
jgi:D-glycero-alpha-D-manno-heptose 1-phosphate guanylyltransferase